MHMHMHMHMRMHMHMHMHIPLDDREAVRCAYMVRLSAHHAYM